MRSAAGGAWETAIRQGSAALSGFGSFAERSEVKGFPYFNTGLKSGDDYRDRAGSKFFSPDPSYILIEIPREGERMTVKLKGLDGATLDQSEWPGRVKPATAASSPRARRVTHGGRSTGGTRQAKRPHARAELRRLRQ